ncbi:glycosyltransferase family 2 protein [Methanococcoides burtonii]|uniref:Glycosyl transferase, family 2 n=1 Tax=Methanococcoides burtonii (strain DSM 6242 / NBRC 107633 / OCM 468 / ACE-M) TaxID=259564 RepID=Q12VL4_METBU|nr:glycosyltransferase family 2 protein [Methanococcoides burtonii]ABE52512.1 glycosyl transferase, family 2 [Methanococcoides burtonii DSM 6242]
MNMLLTLTIILSAIPVLVYMTYILAAITSKPKQYPPLKSLPKISIVIPAYNEEEVIEDRINNLAEIYPIDKMEIIVSNDGSVDNTEEIARSVLKKHSIEGKVLTHDRSGVNKAINRGINETSQDLVIITGSDGLFDKDTIPNLLGVLLSSDDIGAVSGDLVPVAKGESIFSNSEAAYRSIYGKICTWESNVHSTYCFNGPVVAFKKEASSSLNTRRGADDASMALSVIKKGYRCQYVPSAKFYEYVPDKFHEQRRQKIRRATRLLEATFFNRNVLSTNCGRFRTVVFPLRLMMLFLVPTLVFLSIVLWMAYLFTVNPIYSMVILLAIVLSVAFGSIRTNILSSFLIYQAYLFLGLFNMLRDVHVWEPTERIKI